MVEQHCKAISETGLRKWHKLPVEAMVLTLWLGGQKLGRTQMAFGRANLRDQPSTTNSTPSPTTAQVSQLHLAIHREQLQQHHLRSCATALNRSIHLSVTSLHLLFSSSNPQHYHFIVAAVRVRRALADRYRTET